MGSWEHHHGNSVFTLLIFHSWLASPTLMPTHKAFLLPWFFYFFLSLCVLHEDQAPDRKIAEQRLRDQSTDIFCNLWSCSHRTVGYCHLHTASHSSAIHHSMPVWFPMTAHPPHSLTAETLYWWFHTATWMRFKAPKPQQGMCSASFPDSATWMVSLFNY